MLDARCWMLDHRTIASIAKKNAEAQRRKAVAWKSHRMDSGST
jgi:hypothetical protein